MTARKILLITSTPVAIEIGAANFTTHNSDAGEPSIA
jgi:hypothetical protein